MSLIKLQGNASGTGAFTIAAPNGNTDRTLTLPDATGTVLAAPAGAVTISSSAPSNSLTVDASGNLGLGVTPSAWTSSVKAAQLNTKAAIYGSSSATGLGFNVFNDGSNKYLTTDAATLYLLGAGSHAWYNAPSGTAGNAITFTQAMTLDSSGNLLVGTTTTFAASKATIKGAGNTLTVWEQSGSSAAALICRVDNTGGRLTTYNYNGSDVGTVTTNGTSTSYNTSSDYRLKENVVPLAGAADRLSQIPVHRFNFIADPDRTVDGFLAHEVQEFVPECVTGQKDEVDADGNPVYQGIDQSKLVPLLTAALQEALAEIANLKTRLTALEAN